MNAIVTSRGKREAMANKKKSGPSRVFIVDDHPIVRQGLAHLIDKEKDLCLCGSASDAKEAMALIRQTKPDIALVDITLEGTSGIELTKALTSLRDDLRVLVVSMHDETLYAGRALRAGAKGYIMKHEAPETVLTAIRTVLAGNTYLGEAVAARLLREFSDENRAGRKPAGVEALTDRELEVFQLIGRGLTTRLIADTLNLSVKTIETYRAHIKTKLGLRNGTELVHHAIHWIQGEGDA